jgi:hypothetical protein
MFKVLGHHSFYPPVDEQYPPELEVKETTDTASSSGNQNNGYWPLHNESIARYKHHMQEKLVYCCRYLGKL